MANDGLNDRLSRIQTAWTVLGQVNADPAGNPAEVQLLLARYLPAVRRYLLAAVKDEALVDDLAQEFAVTFLQGGFRHACPQRGRFRDYVKTALFRMVAAYYRRIRQQPRPASGDFPEIIDESAPPPGEESRFDEAWRKELLARTWHALAGVQPQGHTVLKYRAENPDVSSADLAPILSQQLGRALTADGVRQLLHRARECFANLLLDQVAHSLEQPGREAVEQELIDLGLYEYCRGVL